MPLNDQRSLPVVLALLVVAVRTVDSLTLSNITGSIKLDNLKGRLAVFADFNADKATDILVLNGTGDMIYSDQIEWKRIFLVFYMYN